MSTCFKIFGYVDQGVQIGQQALTSDEMKALLTRKKVEKAFVFHYASTFASFFYSIYTCIPTYKFSQSHRKNALLLTMFMSTSLILHIFFKNRQNPYVTYIKDLCKEKLVPKEFIAFSIDKSGNPSKTYICSKDSQNQVTLSSIVLEEGAIDNHIKTHLKRYKEISLQELIARRP